MNQAAGEDEYEEDWGEDEDVFVDVTVRLCLLRSKEVEWYEGPEKAEEDAKAILADFSSYAESTWKLVEENEEGVFALFESPDGPNYNVNINLLGLKEWEESRMTRDPSRPQEPYLVLRFRSGAECDPGRLHSTVLQFGEWIGRFSGLRWESQDLPHTGVSGMVEGKEEGQVLDQAAVLPPSSSSCVQKADEDEDRPALDTSAIFDWLLPELLVTGTDDDLCVAGTTPRSESEAEDWKEGYFGVKATGEKVPSEEELQARERAAAEEAEERGEDGDGEPQSEGEGGEVAAEDAVSIGPEDEIEEGERGGAGMAATADPDPSA